MYVCERDDPVADFRPLGEKARVTQLRAPKNTKSQSNPSKDTVCRRRNDTTAKTKKAWAIHMSSEHSARICARCSASKARFTELGYKTGKLASYKSFGLWNLHASAWRKVDSYRQVAPGAENASCLAGPALAPDRLRAPCPRLAPSGGTQGPPRLGTEPG